VEMSGELERRALRRQGQMGSRQGPNAQGSARTAWRGDRRADVPGRTIGVRDPVRRMPRKSRPATAVALAAVRTYGKGCLPKARCRLDGTDVDKLLQGRRCGRAGATGNLRRSRDHRRVGWRPGTAVRGLPELAADAHAIALGPADGHNG